MVPGRKLLQRPRPHGHFPKGRWPEDPDQVKTASQLLFTSICFQMGSDQGLLENQRKLWEKKSLLCRGDNPTKKSSGIVLKPDPAVPAQMEKSHHKQTSGFGASAKGFPMESRFIKQIDEYHLSIPRQKQICACGAGSPANNTGKRSQDPYRRPPGHPTVCQVHRSRWLRRQSHLAVIKALDMVK